MISDQSHRDHIQQVSKQYPALKAWVAIQNQPQGIQIFLYDLRINDRLPLYAFGILGTQMAEILGMQAGQGYVIPSLNWSELSGMSRPPGVDEVRRYDG